MPQTGSRRCKACRGIGHWMDIQRSRTMTQNPKASGESFDSAPRASECPAAGRAIGGAIDVRSAGGP